MITGILLAAGAATRFGSPKLLHTLPEGAPIGHFSAMHLRSGVDRAIAVVPPAEPALMRLLADAGLSISICELSRHGMGASLACGVQASIDADGWIIALADMPYIQPSTIAAVAQALREGAPIAAPVFDGRRGHPVGFNRAYLAELAGLTGDMGARMLLQRERTRILHLPVNDAGIHRDIDTLDDLPQ